MQPGDRYKCQIALPGFGQTAQQKLAAARVLIVGMGGLGCPAAQYLAAAGVGTLGLVDADRVSASNLHRQILFGPGDIGRHKVEVAAERLSRQNTDATIIQHIEWFTPGNALAILAHYDIVLDCADSFNAKYLISDAGVLAGIPVVYGAIYQFEGQVAVWNAPNSEGSRSPHYRDVFPEANAARTPACADGGVLPPLAGAIGCLQANEVIKLITGTGELLAGKLLLYNSLDSTSRIIKTGNKSRISVTALATDHITQLTLTEWQQQPDTFYLVDVRTPAEHAAGNLGGINIPLAELNASHLAAITQPILFYCATGKRSMEAARLLQGTPGVEIYTLAGGIPDQ